MNLHTILLVVNFLQIHKKCIDVQNEAVICFSVTFVALLTLASQYAVTVVPEEFLQT